MEFYETVKTRRTVREFSAEAVAENAVRRVLQAGLAAPSNAHIKPWQFVLLRNRAGRKLAVIDGLKARDIKDREEIEKFLGAFEDEALKAVYRRALPIQLTMMLEAPEVLVVCTKIKPLRPETRLFDLNPIASVWMCIENIMLALAAEGLFGCTYTPYDGEGLKLHLGIPEEFVVAAVIPFGRPRSVPPAPENEVLDRRLHIDRW